MAHPIESSAPRNHVLAYIPRSEMEALKPRLSLTRLVVGQSLYEPGHTIDHVYFLEHGLASVMARANGAKEYVEVALIGREGMVGLPALLGAEATIFSSVIVQIPGEAWRLSRQALHELLPDSPVLLRKLYQVFEIFLAQVTQTAACNSQHALLERLARWLLMVRERGDEDDLPLKQDFLSIMLGVSRPAVTIAMSKLEGQGLVQQYRGHVTIKDQAGLAKITCECFNRVNEFSYSISQRNPFEVTAAPPATSTFVAETASPSKENVRPKSYSRGYFMGHLLR